MLVDKVHEMCPHCDTEVKLQNVQYQTYTNCPNCDEPILPCALCDMDKVICNECLEQEEPCTNIIT